MATLLYFMEQTDGLFDAADDGVAYPLDSFMGFEVSGTTTTLYMNFKGVRDSNANATSPDQVTLTITANKQKETMEEILGAINNSRSGFIAFDAAADNFPSQYISAVSLSVIAGGV